MKSKLSMTFEEFHGYGRYPETLTGYLDRDLSENFQLMVYRMFPSKLPKGYLYATRECIIHETGVLISKVIFLGRVCDNFVCCACHLDLSTSEIVVIDKNDDEIKIINNYFIQLLTEIIEQMKQYYRDYDIELKKDLTLHQRDTLSGRKEKII